MKAVFIYSAWPSLAPPPCHVRGPYHVPYNARVARLDPGPVLPRHRVTSVVHTTFPPMHVWRGSTQAQSCPATVSCPWSIPRSLQCTCGEARPRPSLAPPPCHVRGPYHVPPMHVWRGSTRPSCPPPCSLVPRPPACRRPSSLPRHRVTSVVHTTFLQRVARLDPGPVLPRHRVTSVVHTTFPPCTWRGSTQAQSCPATVSRPWSIPRSLHARVARLDPGPVLPRTVSRPWSIPRSQCTWRGSTQAHLPRHRVMSVVHTTFPPMHVWRGSTQAQSCPATVSRPWSIPRSLQCTCGEARPRPSLAPPPCHVRGPYHVPSNARVARLDPGPVLPRHRVMSVVHTTFPPMHVWRGSTQAPNVDEDCL
ncbi:hypothetical protein J6590_083942 [Homalodisca vitripennis]|nr:hypothetical protein J6590_083942 [Homalodisca vitripennis]